MKQSDLDALKRAMPDLSNDIDALQYSLDGANDAVAKDKVHTFHGTWNTDNRPTCHVCGARFDVPIGEGVPLVTEESSGLTVVACPACFVALVAIA